MKKENELPPHYLYIGEKAYGYDEFVSKEVALKVTGLALSTFDREVKEGRIAKHQYGETKQSKVQFFIRDLAAYRVQAYTKTLSTTDIK